MLPALPPGSRLSCAFSVTEGIGHVLIWVLLTVLTLGLALFVAPYYFLKAPINKTTVVDASGRTVGRLVVEVNLAEVVGHAVIWVLLTILTLGLALILYQFSVIKRLLNAIVIEPV